MSVQGSGPEPESELHPNSRQAHQLQQPIFDISSLMLGKPHPLPTPIPAPDLPDNYQDAVDGDLDSFAFTHGAFDQGFDDSFGGPGFSFEDFVNDDAVTFAVDQGFGAA